MGKADLHIHSGVGDGMVNVPELLDYVEEHTDLDVIAITDHDDIAGAYQARELAAKGRYRFQVVVGMEVTTRAGHVLALFLERPVPSLQLLEKTIRAVHAQGGLCIAPHPLSWLTRSIGQSTLDRLTHKATPGVHLDGIEMVTANLAGQVTHHKAKLLNERRYRLPETGGSDAHFLAQVGTGYTLFEGHTAEELRQSLLKGNTRAVTTCRVAFSDIGYSQIVEQQFKSLAVLPYQLIAKRLRRLRRYSYL